MSNYKRTIVLGLDYSEFSGGIADAANKMKVLESEYKAAAEEAKGFGDESDQLRLRQDKLAQQIMLQTRSVELSRRALEDAESSGKASERQLDRLRTQYNNNRQQLAKLNNELEETYERTEEATDRMEDLGEQLEETKETERSFGDAIRDVSGFLGLEACPAVENFAAKFDGVNEKVGAAILTIGTLVTTLGSLTMKTAETAKEIANVSQTMGMNTDQYQQWDYVLKMVGYSAESASGDLAALAEKAMDAANGTGEGAEMFGLLGMSVKNASGQLKSQNELFTEVVLRLQDMEDVTKRNAIASAMLSTTGEQLVPVLNMTKEELKGLFKEARDTGYVMSGETLEGFQDLNETMTKFDGVVEGLSNKFAVALLPMLTALFSAISSIPTPVLQLIITFASVVASIVAVSKAVESVTGVWGKLGNFMEGFDQKSIKTAALIMGIVAALIALAAIITVIMGKSNELGRAMESVGTNVNRINTSVSQTQNQAARYHASGTDYFEGGETWVGEQGPEKVVLPQGSRIINNREAVSSEVNHYYITIDAKNVRDFNRVVEIMDGLKQAGRRNGVM